MAVSIKQGWPAGGSVPAEHWPRTPDKLTSGESITFLHQYPLHPALTCGFQSVARSGAWHLRGAVPDGGYLPSGTT